MLPILGMRKPDLNTVIAKAAHFVERLFVANEIFPGFEVDIVAACLLP